MFARAFDTIEEASRLFSSSTGGDVRERKSDIAVVGAGVLGTTIAFWLTELHDCSVVLVDKEQRPAAHTTSRNTGVIHRPFYLDPKKKRLFASASQRSYSLWLDLASRFQLPWKQVGTLEVATRDADAGSLQRYMDWGSENGMREEELELLDSKRVREMEPLVECVRAIHSRTDTAVDYGQFTSQVFELGRNNGLITLMGSEVTAIEESSSGVEVTVADEGGSKTRLKCRLLVNAAGGSAIDLAHTLNLGMDLTDLHFRGEYWVVDDSFGPRISRNIYSVARYQEFPFLDPHFIVRATGRREIGPNAVLVAGPYAYEGLSDGRKELIKKVFERPVLPKVKLFTNRNFLGLVRNEWRSSMSKDAMCERVRRFIPSLESHMLTGRGSAGIRSSIIDAKGFVSEPIKVRSAHSFHILNYNSPGATGAPAFSAHAVQTLRREGYLDGIPLKRDGRHDTIWSFDYASDID